MTNLEVESKLLDSIVFVTNTWLHPRSFGRVYKIVFNMILIMQRLFYLNATYADIVVYSLFNLIYIFFHKNILHVL